MSSEEIWKDIPGYEGRYMVSSYGRVKSLDRLLRSKGGFRIYKGKILKPWISQYYNVRLYKDGCKGKPIPIHKLVALAFLSKIPGCNQVNHKDENKLNNRVENLEWCTSKYNCSYGTRNNRIVKKRTALRRSNAEKSVRQYNLNGEFICEYASISLAGRVTGVSFTKISLVCKGQRLSAGGFGWRFASDGLDNIEKIERKDIPVAQFLKDGTLVSEYSNLHEAARKTGILRQSIVPSIKRNGSSGGFIWKYVDK